MSKKPTRLKKLRLTELSLVSTGANQFSSIGIFKAAEPEPKRGDFPSTVEVIKGLQNATPEARDIFKQMIDGHQQWLENFQKSHEESDTMTNIDPNFHYNKAVSDYAARHDLPISKAAVDIISARPDLVEQAYALDGQTAVAREQAKVAKLYGGAA